jgi:hypothetical protein
LYIEHIGSAHDDAEVELLQAVRAQRLALGHRVPDLGLDAGAAGGPLPITAPRTGCLLDALKHGGCRILIMPPAVMRCSGT